MRLMSTKQAGADSTRSPFLLDNPDALPDGLSCVSTPAFVYDESVIARLLTYADQLSKEDRCRILFAIKSFSFFDALQLMSPRLDGFAVSSLFEAKLAQEANIGRGSVHITTPGLRSGEVDEISSLCDYVSFNSLSQWDMYEDRIKDKASCGLRVNPQLSFLDDERYDPCRSASKLGVPLNDLVSAVHRDPGCVAGVRGILFHSNADAPDFGELLTTGRHLYSSAERILENLEWINLGGGYLFEDGQSLDGLHRTLDFIKSRSDVEVFFEPGSALIRSAGYIVSTVLDVFPSGGSLIAVLDTSVNHMPEVFEYDFEPDVVGHNDDSPNAYVLAGCTCLAGDLFGEYRFPDPLQVGDKVIFNNAGSYTLTKAHVFNGVALPSVYALTPQGEFVLKSSYTFDQYAARWGRGPQATP